MAFAYLTITEEQLWLVKEWDDEWVLRDCSGGNTLLDNKDLVKLKEVLTEVIANNFEVGKDTD